MTANEASPARRRRLGLSIAFGIVVALVAVLAACEASGWRFLAKPAERWISGRLQRNVSFDASLRLSLLGGIRLKAAQVRVDNPDWSALGPMLVASDATLELRYRDLLAFRRGGPLHVDALVADTLVLAVERRRDGSASWQFGDRKPVEGDQPGFDGVRFGKVAVRQGNASIADALLKLQAKADFGLAEEGEAPAPAAAASDAARGGASQRGLRARADGSYDGQPLHATLRAGSTLTLLSEQSQKAKVPVELHVRLGRARLAFTGDVSDPFGTQALDGRYDVGGPSLAAVGELLGVTLPTTHAFSMQGSLDHRGSRWHTAVHRATIGSSRLDGDFTYDGKPGAVPMLTGRLGGPVLYLQDLGPAVGTQAEAPAQRKRAGRVLPQREFDLPSLRAMNADVAVAIERAEFGPERLQAVEPLAGHIGLQDGVLDITRLDARLAQGHIRGRIRLDGRGTVALWEAQLALTGLLVEQWIAQPRAKGGPPYVTGRLGAKFDVTGRGRSAAQLLASANGRAIVHWTGGGISHLAVEAAGIDIAQGLGVMFRGDKLLPVTCSAADLAIDQGRVTPTVMLVDTADSTLWVTGSLSLATEEMHLVMSVDPKDVSPLTLRAPVHVDGPLNAPKVSIDKKSALRRIVPAIVLGAINPLAAIIPFIDLGDDESKAATAACRSVPARRGGQS